MNEVHHMEINNDKLEVKFHRKNQGNKSFYDQKVSDMVNLILSYQDYQQLILQYRSFLFLDNIIEY
jgi:hypothetical protein